MRILTVPACLPEVIFLWVIAQAQSARGAVRGGGLLFAALPADLGRTTAARASCQTMRTSECGSKVSFVEPRKGRVRREPGSLEAEEPGVEAVVHEATGAAEGTRGAGEAKGREPKA